MIDPKRQCSWLFRNSETKKSSPPKNKSGIKALTGVGVNRRTSRNLARLLWKHLIMRVSLAKDFFLRIGGLTFSGENVAGQGGTTAVISSSQNPVSGLFPSRGPRGVVSGARNCCEHHVDSHHVRQRSSLRASDAGPDQPLGSSPRLGIVQPRDAAWRKTSNR